MKKFLVSFCFVVAGSAMWWGLSNTVRFSIKKWDVKFENVLRHGLSSIGISNKNVLSTVNELKKDDRGEYVLKRMEFKGLNKDKIARLAKEMETAGADIKLFGRQKNTILMVKHGARTYQEITFIP